MFFDNWGSIDNPVRQSDLNALFGSTFRCAKAFALSKIYPLESKPRVEYKRAFGEILHEIISAKISLDQILDLQEWTARYERNHIIDYKQKDRKEILEYYGFILQKLFACDTMKSICSRKIFTERSFMVKIGNYYVAGTVDLVMKGKGNRLVLIDWKTSKTIPRQYVMNNSYQSRIYRYAVKYGEFFVKPISLSSGKDYGDSYRKTMQKIRFDSFPKIIYAYISDLYPLAKKSIRKSVHISTKPMADKEGNILLSKGDDRGPVFYETEVNQDIKRIEYSIGCAITMAKAGLFPETFGPRCERCVYRNKCEQMGTDNLNTKQDVLALMNEMGIEAD